MPSSTTTRKRVAPFLKWAGGKRLLVPQILPHVPPLAEGRRYFEPFLGGGAMFFAFEPQQAILSDLNPELIDAFCAVRDDVDAVIRHLRPLTNDSECYYRVRSSRPRSPAGRAARLIYLNKTCFNGLFRVNLRGEFNVPFGKHTDKLVICDENQLREAALALRGSDVTVKDFGHALRRARAGDLVYLDPPYTIAHTNNGFIEYNAKVFSWADQRRLAKIALKLVERGVQIVMSNADHPSIMALYASPCFRLVRIPRWSTMAGDTKSRFATSELIIVGGGDF
jgi:DNA adenine methylase